MTVIDRRIDELTPYAKNAKKHDATQVKNLAESIKKYGFKVPVIIDKDGVIVAGHGRVLAAKRLRLETVPCVVADDLTPEEINAFRLVDNKSAESEWDFDLLAEELTGLDLSDFDFDWGVNVEPEVVEVPAPAVNKEGDTLVQPGDRWQLGDHFLMCGDSTSAYDVQALVGGVQMDMLLTDPPYNVNYEGTAGKIQNDNMEDSAFRQFLTDAFINAYMVMKKGAAFHIWHADSEGYNFRGACRDAGLRVRQCLIWVKNSLVLGRQDFQWQHEPCLSGEMELGPGETDEAAYDDEHDPCLYGWVDGKHYWYKNRKQTTLLYFDKPTKSADHPTMKPVKLFDYEMKCNTRPGDRVLDLFGGSGTTIMAAEQNGRKAYVMEFDPRYADVIIKRWEDFTGNKAVKLSGKDTENV